MLATKSAGSEAATSPPYNLAAATTVMMWACALATARVTVASTARSLELWSQVLCSVPAPVPDHDAAAAPSHADAAAPADGREPSAETPAAPIPFASYRSSGGHAAAQVAIPD